MTTTQQEFGIAFHCHHKRLIEVVTGFSNRVEYIQSDKPANEQATRVRLSQMVPDDLLPWAVQATLSPARDAWTKRKLLDTDHEAKRNLLDKDYKAKRKPLTNDYKDYWAKRNLLDTDYVAKRKPLAADYWAKRGLLDAAVAANMPALEALHTRLCQDCPWDGTTIFPKKTP